jgi:pyocin large subunit-like protein
MHGLRRALLALIAAGALSTAPVALAGGNNGNYDGNNDGNGNNDGKVTICHATGSATNPYVEITISVNAVAAHERHQDGRDIIPAPAGGCPDKKKDDGKKNDNGKKDDH